jgi:hypothetical protein
MVEYLGMAVIAIPVTAAILYFVLNKKDNPTIEQPKIENVDSVGSFVLVRPVEVEVKKIETPVIKKEPVKKIDSIVKTKEIKEEPKKDTPKMYFEES